MNSFSVLEIDLLLFDLYCTTISSPWIQNLIKWRVLQLLRYVLREYRTEREYTLGIDHESNLKLIQAFLWLVQYEVTIQYLYNTKT